MTKTWVLTQEHCDEIAEMEFKEAFETAYGYLVQSGLDADEILSGFTEQTKESKKIK